MTFEKHLQSISRAASQRLGILRMSWQVLNDWLLLGRCFPGFILPVLECCSAVWCSAADTHLKLLDRVVSGTSFRCNPMHPLCGGDRTRGAVILIGTLTRLLSAEPRNLLLPCQYLCGTNLETPYSMVRDWQVSRTGPMPFYWPSCSLPFCLRLFSLSLLGLYGLVLWGWCLRINRVLIALSQPDTANSFNNNNNKTSIKCSVFYKFNWPHSTNEVRGVSHWHNSIDLTLQTQCVEYLSGITQLTSRYERSAWSISLA